MVELRQIEIFLVVAEELNFNRAANRLNTTQPSISKAISLLEHQLDVKLFERTTRSVHLTKAGKELYKQADGLIRQAYELSRSIKYRSSIKNKTFTIGASSIVYISVLPKILENFRIQEIDLEVEVTELNTEVCMTKIDKGDVDIGLILLPALHEQLTIEPLFSSKMKLAVSKHHPLANDKNLSLKMFAKDTLLLHSRNEPPYVYDQILECYKKAGIIPITRENPHENCMGRVLANMGIHFVPAQQAELFSGDNVIYLDVEPAPRLEFGIAWCKSNLYPPIQRFVDISFQVAAQMSSSSHIGLSRGK